MPRPSTSLCFGWLDGQIRRIDETSYAVRSVLHGLQTAVKPETRERRLQVALIALRENRPAHG